MVHQIWNLLVNRIASSSLSTALRINIYKKVGMKLESNSIGHGCYFTGTNFRFGQGSWINRKCYFDNDKALIEIGDNCSIAMEVMFCTSTHEISTSERRAGKSIGLPIRIGKGCWIGTRAIILPGVTIGEGCVVAAGSVVNRDCEPNYLYAGNPARKVKKLDVIYS